MAGIEIVDAHDGGWVDGHVLASHRDTAGCRSRWRSPERYSLWMVEVELEAGAALVWDGTNGEEAVFVYEGELAVDDRRCPPRGAVVVEAGVTARATAVGGSARVVHMGSYDGSTPSGLNGAPADEGHGVHVVGPRGTYAAVTDERDTHYYADSTCPTCRLTLLYTARSVAYVSAPHSHSVDELIQVLDGEIFVGKRRLGPGATLAIAGDRRYAFRSGPDGFAFINYRRDASEQTLERDQPPRMEGGAINGLVAVMDLR